MDMTTNRRAFLAAAPALALLTAGPAPALAVASADAAVLAAWARWQAAQKEMRALPLDLPAAPGDDYSPEERKLWNVIDAAEETIRSLVATTPRGVAVQLYIALVHQSSGRVSEEALIYGNVSHLHDHEREHDWDIRLVLAALRSLEAMEA